jgi:hypothetical protein
MNFEVLGCEFGQLLLAASITRLSSDCTVRNRKNRKQLLSAVDMVGLVMVSAGISLANIVSPRDKGEAAVAAPSFAINMGFGTFVEASYPFMFSNKYIFAGAILSSD